MPSGELQPGNPAPGGGGGPFLDAPPLTAGPVTPTIVILLNQVPIAAPPPAPSRR